MVTLCVAAACQPDSEPSAPLAPLVEGDDAIEGIRVDGAQTLPLAEWSPNPTAVEFETWRTTVTPRADGLGFAVDLDIIAHQLGSAPERMMLHPFGADSVLAFDLSAASESSVSFDVDLAPPNLGPDTPDFNVCLEYVYTGFTGETVSPTYQLCLFCDFVDGQDVNEAAENGRCRGERLHRSALVFHTTDPGVAGSDLGILVNRSTVRGPGIREAREADSPDVKHGGFTSDWGFADGPPPPTPYDPPRPSVGLYFDGLSSRFTHQTPPLVVFDAAIVLQEEEVSPTGTILQEEITCSDAPENPRCAVCGTPDDPLVLDIPADDRGHPIDLALLCAMGPMPTAGGDEALCRAYAELVDGCYEYEDDYQDYDPVVELTQYCLQGLASEDYGPELRDYYTCLSMLDCAGLDAGTCEP